MQLKRFINFNLEFPFQTIPVKLCWVNMSLEEIQTVKNSKGQKCALPLKLQELWLKSLYMKSMWEFLMVCIFFSFFCWTLILKYLFMARF